MAFALLTSSAQVIPEDRRIEWIHGQTVGMRGHLTNTSGRTLWTNLVDAGGDPTGVIPVGNLLIALGNTCPSNKYIYAPAGTYTLTNTWTHNNGNNFWSLRGAGTNTIFRPTVGFAATVGFVGWDNSSFTAPYRIHTNVSLVKGSTNLTVIGIDLSPYVGKMIMITASQYGRTNLHVIDIFATDRIMKQPVVIDSVTDGTNVNFWPPLVWDYPKETDPWLQLNGGTESKGITFEDFTVEGGTAAAFTLSGNTYIAMKGLKIIQGTSYALNAAYMVGLEGGHCYALSTNAGSGSAMWYETYTSGSFFYNMYGVGGSPFFEVNGSMGGAYVYNYGTNNVSNDFHVGNPYDNHIPHSMMCLFEGNSGTMYQQDAYFGSASHNTLFRNNFHGWDPIKGGMPRAIHLGRWSTYFNIVGNVLGDTNRTGWYYIMTNLNYGNSTPVILNIGYPGPASQFYFTPGHETPYVDWRFPGARNRVGVATNTSAVVTNRIAIGVFTNVAVGDLVIFQSGSDTNYYYPMATNFVRLTVTDTNAGYIELNRDITYTNGCTVYKIGDGTFYGNLYADDISTTLLHGNTDATNGFDKIIWDRSGTVSDSNLPPSLIFAGIQPWMTNRVAGTNLTFPYVNPTNAFVGDWAARSLWEDAAMGAVNPTVTNVFMQGVQALRGVQAIQ